MRINQSSKFNVNYAAKIIQVKDFTPHPNPKCERMKCVHVDGYMISVSKDTQPGQYIYFPVGCQIANKYLAANNLFRHNEFNANKEASPGFFEDNGRVKPIKLQGVPSEGFIMPIDSLYKWLDFIGESHEVVTNLKEGTEFDSLDKHILCKKYVVNPPKTSGNSSRQAKQPKGISKLVENQFRFHYDTVLIKKCPWVIKPNDIISITSKVHGTSGIWGEAHSKLSPYLTKGLTLYYEIIGWLPTGQAIQAMNGKAYDYGYERPIWDPTTQTTPYEYGKNFGIQIYRITYTNPDGVVFEFSARQVQQWCKDKGLIPVEQLYYGYAKDLYPELDETEHWNENFIQKLANDKRFYMEELSPTCHNDVPHEGIVIRIENGLSEAYKLKCFRFLGEESKSLDKGEIDIEADQ